MKYIVLLGFLSLSLACGGATTTPPETTAPPPGPGTVAAPDGVPIAYSVAGSGSPALVFIHGWLCDQMHWTEQIEVFSAGNTLVTIDLPGHGRSGMEREGWPLMAFGADVAAVVDHLELDQVILVGHSMGGPVALEAARLMPDRVIGVVGVDSLQDADYEYEPEQIAAMLAAFESDFEGTCARFVASMFTEGADPALVEHVKAGMCDGPSEVGVTIMRQYVNYDMAAAVGAIDVPVRCVNCAIWPTNVEGNRAHHADFNAVIIDGPGHFLMMEAPEEFNLRLAEVIAEISGPS
jgi:pimeloyl-ACP methyl ester carboxylesterase